MKYTFKKILRDNNQATTLLHKTIHLKMEKKVRIYKSVNVTWF